MFKHLKSNDGWDKEHYNQLNGFKKNKYVPLCKQMDKNKKKIKCSNTKKVMMGDF